MEKEGATENQRKIDGLHKNLLIVFTAIGIVSFTLGSLVNYYTLKRIKG